MRREFRLRRSTDFKRVRRTGKSYAHPLIVLIVDPTEQGGIKIGISASHTVGNAVNRNRVKRRLRAVMDELLPAFQANADVILLARKPIVDASFDDLRKAVSALLMRAGLLTRD
ncbi:MAG: ribonuclease P protein component [Chloroflexi bacterium]|nr:ribonuclease P protein component [Chloroflexota bacterium]